MLDESKRKLIKRNKLFLAERHLILIKCLKLNNICTTAMFTVRDLKMLGLYVIYTLIIGHKSNTSYYQFLQF